MLTSQGTGFERIFSVDESNQALATRARVDMVEHRGKAASK